MKSLLLVEDDPALASHWAEILREGGWGVHLAADAREALEVREHVDVLFCEAELPDTSGVEIARALRRRRPTLKVLLLAASMPEQVPSDVRVLMKPFPAERLLATLDDLPLPSPSRTSESVGAERSSGLPAPVLALAAVLLMLAGAGTWWGFRGEPLPEPGDVAVLRGGELRTLEPRGPVADLDELRWRGNEEAARYVVWIRRLDDSVVWQTSTASERAGIADAGLRPGIPYRWEVEAFDVEGRRIGLSEAVEFEISGETR